MKRKAAVGIFALFLLLVSPLSFAEGFSLSKSRVVVNEGGSGSVRVLNTGETALLIQSWVSFYKPDDSRRYGGAPPFFVTPPLYRQGKGNNVLKVISSGTGFPRDRESVFYFNAKAIPGMENDKAIGDKISFSYTMVIKLFYRPDSLLGEADDAYRKLLFSRDEGRLVVKNPTPYYVTFNKISVGGHEIENVQEMVPPFGNQSYFIPAGVSGRLTYNTINDSGGITPDINAML